MGWQLRGVPGKLIAGLLFVLPGAVVIFALGMGYALYGAMPLVQALFMGIKSAVVVIVLQALLTLGGGPWMAVQAAALTLWVTFVPCFLWVFTGAPHIERILARPRLKGGFAGISAAVAGAILNLSVWFALHALFADLRQTRLGPLPDGSTLVPLNVAVAGVAAVLVPGLRFSVVRVLAIMAALSGTVHAVM